MSAKPAAEKEVAAKPAKAVKEKVVLETNNGVSRPKSNTSTGMVWEIADSISAKNKAPATRKEVLDACVEKGLNVATVATQFGRWCKFNGLAKAKTATAPKAEAGEVEKAAA